MNWDKYKQDFIRKYSANKISKEYQEKLLNYAYSLNKKELPIIFDKRHFSRLIGYDEILVSLMCFDKSRYYHHFQIPKRNGKMRHISEPYPTLKEIQYWILNNILAKLPVSKYAKAYEHKIGIIENVKFHKNQKVIIKLDINGFFDSISYSDIFNIFYECGYTKSVCNVLANLCCLENKLPQGSPCSPKISNIYFKKLDERIGSYLIPLGIRYTRYSDDITISGDIENKQIHAILVFIESLFEEKGLSINKRKTKILRQSHCQYVTGVVVNKKISAGRKYKKTIRQEIYYIRKYGIDSHRKYKGIIQENYLYHLLGKINWVLYLEKNNKEFLEYKKFIYELLSEYIDHDFFDVK